MELSEVQIGTIAALAFFAILFLQSGIDKIVDRKGNLDWMTPHFATSPFKSAVPALLTILTLFELVSGFASAAAAVACAFDTSSRLPMMALTLVCVTFLQLFLGQRLAKDYAGAASIAPYFGVALLGLLMASNL